MITHSQPCSYYPTEYRTDRASPDPFGKEPPKGTPGTRTAPLSRDPRVCGLPPTRSFLRNTPQGAPALPRLAAPLPSHDTVVGLAAALPAGSAASPQTGSAPISTPESVPIGYQPGPGQARVVIDSPQVLRKRCSPHAAFWPTQWPQNSR